MAPTVALKWAESILDGCVPPQPPIVDSPAAWTGEFAFVGFALLVRRRAELQDAGEIAIEHRIQALGVSARNQHHLLDQRVQDSAASSRISGSFSAASSCSTCRR